jgi:DNA polymerase-1
MQFYAERDAKVTYDLGMYQIISLRDMDSDFAALFEKKHRPMLVKKLSDVYANEMALTKTCFNMEKIGIKIDRKYIVDARLHESIRMKEAVNEFETLTGQPFKNSSKRLAEIFAGLKEEVGRTAKGNLSVDEGALSKMKHPAARAVLKYRDSEKRGNTYFSSYLYWADASDVIHANIKPNGTDTGRFSYGDPNLQNIPKEDSGQFKVRRAFVPRPGYFFGMLDYDQVEYRIMADYSREQTLIDKIMKEGLDVHQACADMMNVTRNEAKTINFMLLYGGGVKKLAAALNIEFEQAEMLRNKYFYTLPNVKEFIRTVIDSAQNSERGYVINWLGRRCHFEDPKFAYKAPNHLIQGGAADVTKVAMNRIDAFLKDKKSRMLVQIHDELLLEIHESEAHILTDIKEIMENSYSPRNGLKLTCGIEHSFISWADKVEGIPSR